MVDLNIDDVQIVWPGKFGNDGKIRAIPRWNLPFQIIETVNETRAARESGSTGTQRSLFEIWSGDKDPSSGKDWKNKLIWGENKFVISSLLEKYGGKVDLIYIDPPFATGADFSFQTQVGDESVVKSPSAIEMKAYRDTWGGGISSYIEMMYDRLTLMKDLLSPTGSIYVHCDWRVNSYMRATMDEVFGSDNFRNEIVWRRSTSHSDAQKYGQVHDIIYWYTKGPSYTWHPQFRPYSEEYIDRYFRFQEPNGRRYWKEDATGAGSGPPRRFGDRLIAPPPGRHWRWTQDTIDEYWKRGMFVLTKSGKPEFKRYLDEQEGEPVSDVWDDIKRINMMADERLGYPTQKPEALLERIVTASSNKEDLVADFFCGSGTTLTVAEKLGRRWIGCDLSRFAIHTTRKRLLNIAECKPFEILNLGKYERQVWQDLSFAGKKGQSVIYEYLAFILKLYDAQPISGFQSVHGRRGPALIHVGSVDAPVTIGEVMAAVDECINAKQSELHVLGWEWEMGIHDLVETEARKKGVKVLLKQIPSDVMEPQVSKEDIHFFDLAYVQAKAAVKKMSAQVEIQDFGIPSSDLIRDDIRKSIRHWSDLIDYWAVDFDFKNDTFLNSWQSYRTQDSPKLELKSSFHEYEKRGKHQILVKVVDIFGIDSSKLLEVEV